ncbi:Ribosomal-protein-alanine acetyltransferase, partial [Fasciolopsis buskii]
VVSALLILSEGTEELEAVTVADVLNRGKIKVTIGGLQGSRVLKCSNGVKIQPDVALTDVASDLFDAVIMPGGLGGSQAMAESSVVKKILQHHYENKKIVAAICAAPIGLQSHEIGLGKKVTSYPGFEGKLKGFTYCSDQVVVDGNLVTSRGPGTAMPFALKLLELLVDKRTSDDVAKKMLVH